MITFQQNVWTGFDVLLNSCLTDSGSSLRSYLFSNNFIWCGQSLVIIPVGMRLSGVKCYISAGDGYTLLTSHTSFFVFLKHNWPWLTYYWLASVILWEAIIHKTVSELSQWKNIPPLSPAAALLRDIYITQYLSQVSAATCCLIILYVYKVNMLKWIFSYITSSCMWIKSNSILILCWWNQQARCGHKRILCAVAVSDFLPWVSHSCDDRFHATL